MADVRVQFIHGLESSPHGAKAHLFATNFTASTPAMNTKDFPSCVAVHEAEIAAFKPDVLIGSSFGGAVALELLHRGAWTGPTLLLAQAAFRIGSHTSLPEGRVVWIVHGTNDEVVDIDDSRQLARTGTSKLVRLIEVDDDHSLHAMVADGRLLDLVRDIAKERP